MELMELKTFRDSLEASAPPAEISPALQALWYDAKGDWNKAHELAQEQNEQAGAWVHAYLHRKEGDTSNAAYWYKRAGEPMPQMPLETEWEQITERLLRGSHP